MNAAVAIDALPPLRCRPSKIMREIKRCLKVGLVPKITSSPGLGKSDIEPGSSFGPGSSGTGRAG